MKALANSKTANGKKEVLRTRHHSGEFEYGCNCHECACKHAVSLVADKDSLQIMKNFLNPWGEQFSVPIPIYGPGNMASVRRLKIIDSLETNASGKLFLVINTSPSQLLPDALGGSQMTGYQQGALAYSYTTATSPFSVFPDTQTSYVNTQIANIFWGNNVLPYNDSGQASDLYQTLLSMGIEIEMTSSPSLAPVQGVWAVLNRSSGTLTSYQNDIARSGFSDIMLHPNAKMVGFNNKEGYKLQVAYKPTGASLAGNGLQSSFGYNPYYTSPGTGGNLYWGGVGAIVLTYEGQPGTKFRMKLTANVQASGTLSNGTHPVRYSMQASNRAETALSYTNQPITNRSKKINGSIIENYLVKGIRHLASLSGGIAKSILSTEKTTSTKAIMSAINFLL